MYINKKIEPILNNALVYVHAQYKELRLPNRLTCQIGNIMWCMTVDKLCITGSVVQVHSNANFK